ncbi:MAG TPA: HD domain-containing protein [Tepidiformaceae bacterium]|jgi:poly(A) polymerase
MLPDPRLLQALGAADGARQLRELDRRGALTEMLPELEAGRGFVQPERHYYDVLDHNLAAVAAFDTLAADGPDREELRAATNWIDWEASLDREIDGHSLVSLTRLACLVHDIAKPATAIVGEDRLRFPRHGPRGAEILRERLPAAGFSDGATDFVARMVRYHLRPGELIRSGAATDRAVRKFVADVDGHVLPLMLVNIADGMATRGPGYTRENFRRHCLFLNYVMERAWNVADVGTAPLVTGDDLIAALNLSGGRLLGAVLTSVRRAQAEGSVHTKDEALALARTVLVSLEAAEP